MTKPLVSVIVPIYNAEKYLAETIESIINQTYYNLEILLINHNSTDESISIIKYFKDNDKRIKVIDLDINKGGPAMPRNIGVENAKGEYIAFLDADDLWTPYKLEVHLAFMQENDLDFSSTGMQEIDENSQPIAYGNRVNNYLRKKAKKESLNDLIGENFIVLSSVLMKKKIFSPFDESKNMIAVEDFCLWMQLLSRQDVRYRYLDKKLLRYRIVESSISERGTSYRQEVKALICILSFMLKTDRYDLIHTFSKRVLKKIYIKNKLKIFI